MMQRPTLMRATQLTGHGGFETLCYRDDVPVPEPHSGEVLVKVLAAGINNTDINTRVGWYSKGDGDAAGRQLGRAGAELPSDSGRRYLWGSGWKSGRSADNGVNRK